MVLKMYKNIITILGPLLFILYVNDLLHDMSKDCTLSHADHAVIIATEESWFEAQYRTNTNLENIAKWLALNKLSLHTKHENPR